MLRYGYTPMVDEWLSGDLQWTIRSNSSHLNPGKMKPADYDGICLQSPSKKNGKKTIQPSSQRQIARNIAELKKRNPDFERWEVETLDGWLYVGTKQDQVLKRVGTPEKGKVAVEDGLYLQKWNYPHLGVSLYMALKERGGPGTVTKIEITRPSTMKTAMGAAPGMGESIVRNLYRYEITWQQSEPGKLLVVGNYVYGGTIFDIENGKVKKITIFNLY